MIQRGDGVGLEITSSLVRGVRLSHDAAGRIAAVTEIPISVRDDSDRMYDALVRARGQLGSHEVPTRVSWFPARSTMQRLDVTGQTGPELNSLRVDLERDFGANSSMLIDAEARRWMLAMRWDYAGAWRLQELVERAGFADVAIEPSPVALQRVLPARTAAARRDADAERSWAAIFSAGVPVAAIGVGREAREPPGLHVTRRTAGLHRLDALLSEAELGDIVGGIVNEAFSAPTETLPTHEVLSVLGERFPPYPDHDLRAPQRVAVALGSAVGAAGLAGRLRPVDVMSPTPDSSNALPRPWAIERVLDAALTAEPPPPSTLAKALARVRLRPSKR